MDKMETDELIALVQQINRIDYNINVALRCEFDELIDEQLTDKQVIVLNLIRDHPRMTSGEVAQRLDISASAASQLLNTLDKKAMIVRRINPGNRREVVLELTPEAERHMRDMDAVEMAIIRKYYTALDREDLLRLRDILGKLEAIVLSARDGGSP